MKKNEKKMRRGILMYVISLLITSIPAGLAAYMDQSVNNDDSVRYLQPVFDSVNVQKDIVFGEVVNHKGETEKLLLDVYTPAGDDEINRPAILWIHGGGFRVGNDKSQSYIVDMATRFARRGYVGVSIDYRVRENPREDIEGTLTQALEDAMSGLNWLRGNSEEYHVDKNKIVVAGGSAGGMIAVILCLKDNTSSKPWDKSGIIGLVDLWGSPDPSWRVSMVDKDDPPTIIVHGTEDPLVPYMNSVLLIKDLKRTEVKCELISIEGAGHTPAGHMDDFVKKIARFLYEIIL
jgi:acetyl esterase/lipase